MKDTLIGAAAVMDFAMVLLQRLSIYNAMPLATLAVPMTYSSIRFQPMVNAMNSPTLT